MAKRILAVLLSALMMVSLATACGGNSGTSSTGTSSTGSTGSTAATDKVDLSVERDLKILIGQNTFITDYEDNYLTNKLEEELNCNITMEMLPAGDDGLSKLQLMINGGDKLPDVISYSLSPALMFEYGSNGTFLALNDYYSNPDVMPNFNALESEDDKTNMIAAATSADGNMYCITMFQPEQWNLTPYRMYMNSKWLENLDMEMPTTTDELYDVLNAFANEDPNGNGVKDEIAVFALYTPNGGGYGNNVILALLNSFVFTGHSMDNLTLSEDGKTVIAPQISDGWKEGLRYLNTLTQCGAINPDASFIAGTDTAGFKGTLNYQGIGTEPAGEGKSINIVGLASLGSYSGQYPNSATDSNVNFNEYSLMPVVTGPEGKAYSPFNGYNAERYWFITEGASDPAFCAYMGDYFYDFDMSLTVRFGVEEEDWTADEQKCSDWYTQHTALIESTGHEQTYESYKYVMLNEKLWSDNNNKFWHNQQPRYLCLDDFNHMGKWYDPESFVYYNANDLNPLSAQYYYDKHPQYILPMLTYTGDEQDQITEFQISFPDEVLSWTMRFITGELDVDKDWDAYVSALKGLGLDTYVEVSQAAYERTVAYNTYFG